MATELATEPASTTTPRLTLGQQIGEVLLIVVVFFVAAGNQPPDVNESHYLCRLKHFWDPGWCAGDLFLESTDTQVVLIWLFGWVTRFVSLSATAWIGRFLVWTFLAWAWQRLSWRLVPRPLVSALSAALFVFLNERAQLAGEWVVGGVEAKCFAYGFVLLALGAMVDWRWNRVWLLLGSATAFHPLVGGWSVLVCGGVWLFNSVFRKREDADSILKSLRKMLPGLMGGGLVGLLGVLPALMLTWNEPPEIVAEASRIYVFDRLPHHLALLTLPRNEITTYLVRHVVLLATLWAISRAARRYVSSAASLALIAQYAWGAALLAGIGFAIELALWEQPLLAGRLLRYYWFRLTDFAAPTAVALWLSAIIAAGLARRRTWATWALAAALAVCSWHLLAAARERWVNPIPPADAKARDYEAWQAWVDVCAWAAKETPPDALFLTPRLNLSFKWRAGRPEVVNRKDIPQDARGIVEWRRRLKDIYYREFGGLKLPLDSVCTLGTERVRELALKYGADYVLTDRMQLLELPIAYKNKEYVIYKIEKLSGPDGK